MDSSKLAFKFFFQDATGIRTEDFIPVFHRWIQQRALPNHQLIDVADYGHVREGPGTVLVSYEANIHTDLAGGRLGILYIRKHPLLGPFSDRFRTVLGDALRVAALLEKDQELGGRLKFRTDEAMFRINDRLNAPNTAETFSRVRPDVEAVLAEVYRAPVTLSYQPNSESLFEVLIMSASAAPIPVLQDRLATA